MGNKNTLNTKKRENAKNQSKDIKIDEVLKKIRYISAVVAKLTGAYLDARKKR